MKKSELKTGMVVELQSGIRGFVVLDNCCGNDAIIFADDNWVELDRYNNNLVWSFELHDIISVYKPSSPNNFLNFKTLNDHLLGEMECIWEREKNSTTVEVQRFPNKTITITTTVRYK